MPSSSNDDIHHALVEIAHGAIRAEWQWNHFATYSGKDASQPNEGFFQTIWETQDEYAAQRTFLFIRVTRTILWSAWHKSVYSNI